MSTTDHHYKGAAQDLQEAFRQLNPRLQRRLPDAELVRLYQERSTHRNLERLMQRLDNATRPGSEPLHALYVGPSGCGKSMDLSWLAQQVRTIAHLNRALHVVHFGIRELVGVHQVGFAEVSLALALRLHESIPKQPLILEDELRQVVEWLYGEHVQEHIQTAEASASLNTSLTDLIKSALSLKTTRKEAIKINLQPRLADLHKLLVRLMKRFRNVHGKAPLFILDDLEKITPVEYALGLFLNHGGFFSDLPCHAIFTAPNALTLSERYTQEVLSNFRESRLVLAWPGTLDNPSDEAEVLRKIIYRRVAPFLIEPSALNLAIVQTGGVVAQLIEVLQTASVEADLDETTNIQTSHVEYALKAVTTRYSAMLKSPDFEVLHVIGEEGIPSDVTRPALLHNLSVLEYPDSPVWVSVHPLVKPLVQRWHNIQNDRAEHGPE